MERHLARESSFEKWTTFLKIAFPEGVVRHPSVTARVQSKIDELGSECKINNDNPNLSMTFSVKARSLKNATYESNVITANILNLLGFTYDDIVMRTTPMIVDPCA